MILISKKYRTAFIFFVIIFLFTFECKSFSKEQAYHALIIGISEYEDSDLNLENPVPDAKAFSKILSEKYNFEIENITELYDAEATRSGIINELSKLASGGLKNDDSLLIYYAGHGHWKDSLNMGYWIPYDAVLNDISTYVENSTILQYISAIEKVGHVLLISDSCFSGTLLLTRDLPKGETREGDKYFQRVQKDKSRQILSSGSKEAVADGGSLKQCAGHSIFACYLLNELNQNEESYITAIDLFQGMNKAVTNNSDQKPIFGTIKNAGDEGGEFVFVQNDSHETADTEYSQADEEVAPKRGIIEQEPDCGSNSYFDHEDGYCYCNDGYDLNEDNECVSTVTTGECQGNLCKRNNFNSGKDTQKNNYKEPVEDFWKRQPSTQTLMVENGSFTAPDGSFSITFPDSISSVNVTANLRKAGTSDFTYIVYEGKQSTLGFGVIVCEWLLPKEYSKQERAAFLGGSVKLIMSLLKGKMINIDASESSGDPTISGLITLTLDNGKEHFFNMKGIGVEEYIFLWGVYSLDKEGGLLGMDGVKNMLNSFMY